LTLINVIPEMRRLH